MALERAVRRQRAILLAMAAMACGLLLMGAGEPTATELRVRKLVIVDDRGQERIALSASTVKEGRWASIDFRDCNGNVRWVLSSIGEGGAGMTWFGPTLDKVAGLFTQFGDSLEMRAHGDRMGKTYLVR